jgi:ATP-dependent helicase/nuclease subunit A
MNPTAEQITAIQTIDRALLVEAGAGTGKTWVLVQRFVYLLDQHPDWPVDGIFAITFTEKAAREMRTRIRQALERRATERPDDPVWQAHRRNLDRLQVSTIHGLCARILRENAIAASFLGGAAAGLDPRFEVLDENQAVLLKEEAIQQALAEQTLREPIPGEATNHREALNLLASLQVRDLREQMAALMQKRGTVQHLFEELPPVDDLLTRWRAEVISMRRTIWQDKLQNDSDLKRLIADLPLMSITDPQDKLAPAVLLAQQGCGLAAQGNLVAACQAWIQIELRGGRAAAWGDKTLFDELKADLKRLREVAKKWSEAGYLQEVGEPDRQAAQSLQQWQALWLAVSAVYERLKAERYALDFDDLELLTSRLLSQQPRSERLQAFLEGIRHLMVDEFQDTNQAQQEIVYALAKAQDSDPRSGKLQPGGRMFVVGDAKQSIYRFRQAQVAVFNQTARDIQDATGSPAVPLSCSFRTHEQLVAALNSLFAAILHPLGEQPANYEARPGALQPMRPSLDHLSPVELILLPETTDTDATVSAEDGRLFEARLLAEKLLNLQAEGYLVWDKDQQTHRAFRFDDAAILFRSTTSMPLYEEQFKAAGLPYLTVSGRGYYDRPEIRDLIALLNGLYNPADDLNLAAALRSPLFNLSDETLYRLRWHTPAAGNPTYIQSETAIPYSQALHNLPPTAQPEALAFAVAVLDELWDRVGRVPVWRLLRAVLDQTGFEAALALNDQAHANGGRQRSNVAKFLDLAQQNGGASLAEFLRTLADLRASEAREGEGLADAPDSGAVQLMSIHAAKGLEFPVVVVVDLGRNQRRAGETERLMHDPAFGLVCMNRDEHGDWQKPAGYVWARWLNERMEAAEAKRLLYVACTRAADLLILSGQMGTPGSWLEEIQSAWELPVIGEEDQTMARAGFSIRVQRPKYREEDAVREPTVERVSAPLVGNEMPVFALPLPTLSQSMPVSVTRLEQMLANTDREGELQDPSQDEPTLILRPAVTSAEPQSGHIPAYLIGRVIHRVLADWVCLEMPEFELARRVETYARREGITTPDAISATLQRCGRILEDLRGSELYAEICCATQRYSEIPFTLTTPAGVLHGVIDLLYQDSQGRWQMIDWKSERVPSEQMQTHAEKHSLQVAIYAEAARTVLGVMPEVAICFLAVGARVWKYTQANLTDALRQVFERNS